MRMSSKDARKSPTLKRILERVFEVTARQGGFGMQTVDALHHQVPESTCERSGKCCHSIRMYSLEYHRLITHLCEALSMEEAADIIRRALDPSDREVRYGDEVRYRCVFLDPQTQACRVYKARPFMCRIFGHRVLSKRECPFVKPRSRISPEHFYTIAGKVAGVSEQIQVPTERGPEVMEAFPFEFWILRTLRGEEQALAWFQGSHFYEKYLDSPLRVRKTPPPPAEDADDVVW